MKWVPKPGVKVDEKDRPRPLSKDAIRKIAAKLPKIRSPNPNAGKLARSQIIEWLEKELEGIEICPSAIPELVKEIQISFQKSILEPETPIGFTVAEMIAQVSQMSLNSFHQSGTAKNVSYGISALRELLFARKKRKFESTTIYFKERSLSFNDVLAKRADIVGITMANLVKDYEIEDPDTLEKYWWHASFQNTYDKQGKHRTYTPKSRPIVEIEEEPGYEEREPRVSKGRRFNLPQSPRILRLKLDVDKMFAYKVTMGNVISVLEEGNPQPVICVASPLSQGIVDIYPIEEVILSSLKSEREGSEMETNILYEFFLKSFLLESFDKIHVKGVNGIEMMYPVSVPVWSIVITEKRVSASRLLGIRTPLSGTSSLGSPTPLTVTSSSKYSKEIQEMIAKSPRNLWKLELNRNKMITTGIDKEDLFILCETVGFTIIDEEEVIILTNVEGEPSKRINALLAQDDKEAEEEIIKIGLRPEDSKIKRASQFVYADTDGSNLYDLFARDDIDKTRTISNNIFDIASILGIEAARTYFIKELNDVIENSDGYVNPRVLTFIADFMFNRGVPLGLTYTGISRQPIGHLSLSTIERAMKVFRDSAAFGRSESVATTSAAIVTGQTPFLGTTMIDWDFKGDYKEQWEKHMEEKAKSSGEEGPKLSASEFREGFDGFEKLTYGQIDSALAMKGSKNKPIDIFEQEVPLPNVTTGSDAGRAASGLPPVSKAKPEVIKPKPFVLPQVLIDAAKRVEGSQLAPLARRVLESSDGNVMIARLEALKVIPISDYLPSIFKPIVETETPETRARKPETLLGVKAEHKTKVSRGAPEPLSVTRTEPLRVVSPRAIPSSSTPSRVPSELPRAISVTRTEPPKIESTEISKPRTKFVLPEIPSIVQNFGVEEKESLQIDVDKFLQETQK